MTLKISAVCLFILSIFACKKDSDDVSLNLTGTWELHASSGYSGNNQFPAGNGNTYTFLNKSYVQKIKNTDTAYQYNGTFKVYRAKPCDGAAETNLIKFEDQQTTFVISVAGDSLTLDYGPCIADGGSVIYKKIQ